MKELVLEIQEWGGSESYLKQIVDSEDEIKATVSLFLWGSNWKGNTKQIGC